MALSTVILAEESALLVVFSPLPTGHCVAIIWKVEKAYTLSILAFLVRVLQSKGLHQFFSSLRAVRAVEGEPLHASVQKLFVRTRDKGG